MRFLRALPTRRVIARPEGLYLIKAVREKEEEHIGIMQKAGVAITRPDVAPFRDKMAPAYDILRKSIGDENWTNWSRAVTAART